MDDSRIHPAKIGFDFDGVVADTIEAFIRIACEQYDHCGIRPEDITHFSVEQCLNMDVHVADSIWSHILQDSVATGLLPMPGAVEVLGELTLHSEITIITARPEAEPVYQWLQTVFPALVWPRIRVVAMGDSDDKTRHVKDLGLTSFIDDRFETCLQLRKAGIQSIVFSQPWNRNRHDLPTVHTWAEIHSLCL